MEASEMSILVVGGYGTIGRVVCTELADTVSKPVIAGGRSLMKARRFAKTIDGVHASALDVADPNSYTPMLEDIGMVVSCLDQDTPTFARACLTRGIDYIDISPTDDLLKEVESFDELARKNDSTAVLSVGLSPGVTNLFVADALDELDTVDRTDITLLLGIGEAFGPDTIKWTLEDGLGAFTVREDGTVIDVTGLTDPRAVDIPGWGTRRAYRANLADQHVLARTTAIPTIATRLCYDSRLITSYLAALRRLGLYKSLTSLLDPDRIVRLVDRLPFGTDESVVQTEIRGGREGTTRQITRWVRGPNQARATAIVAVTLVRELLASRSPAGVHHIHELVDSTPVVDSLVDSGYTVGRSETSGESV